MKHFLFFLLCCCCLACGNTEQTDENQQPVAETESPVAEPENKQLEGLKLITTSTCRACHQNKEKLIGPAYEDVAKRYPNNDSTVTYLAGKIIQGSVGNWDEVPMPPHPQHSPEEAEEMVRYILTLNR